MVTRVSEHVYMIDTEALGRRGAVAAYLVVGEEERAAVDVGYASSLETLLEGYREAGVEPSELRYIVPTHLHLDHAGAAGQLVKLSQRALVLAHPRAVKHLVNPSRLIASVREVYGGRVEMFGEVLPIEAGRVRGVEDGETVDLGGVKLRFIHAPGHAYHQITVFVEEDGALATGDAVSMKYPDFPVQVPTTPPPSYNYPEAVKTLKKLSRLEGRIVLRPHFGPHPWTDKYFQDQLEFLGWWRKIVEDLVERGLMEDEALKEVMRIFGERSRVKPEEFPPHVVSGLTLSYRGMRLHLEKTRG